MISAERALERNFPDAPHLSQMLNLLERARELAAGDMEDRDAIHMLGEGSVGDEALAIAVYCALRYPDDLEKCLVAAVNHNGDSDSTGAIAGNILGAYLGVDGIPQYYLNGLELRDTMIELADDMNRAVLARYGLETSDWKERYC